MRQLQVGLARVDRWFTAWVAQHGVTALRVSVGIVFFWFGVLKFFPRLSPAEDLAARTIAALSFGVIKPALSVPVLASWECLIGLSLITGRFVRVALVTMFAHMVGTITPLFLFPHETWSRFPYAATLEGQYILKNMVLVSAAFVVYASARAQALADDRDVVSGRLRMTALPMGGAQLER
jgi:uncharacterized membrane protein YphA (DoxX/SURF4 family)